MQSKYRPFIYYLQLIGSVLALALGFILLYFVIIRPFNIFGLLLTLLMILAGLYGLISWGNSDFKTIRIDGNEIFIGRKFKSNLVLLKSDIEFFTEKEKTHENSCFFELNIHFKQDYILTIDSNNLENYREIRSVLINGKIKKNV